MSKRHAEHEQRVLDVLDFAASRLTKPVEFLDVIARLRHMHAEAVAVHGDPDAIGEAWEVELAQRAAGVSDIDCL